MMEETEKEKFYTIVIFSEDTVGLLSQVTAIFTRRGLSIESISASTCSIAGVYKWTLTLHCTESMARKLVLQIEKCIYVIKAFAYLDDEIIYQEVALYKVGTDSLLDSPRMERVIRHHGARVLEITRHYTVIEKTGHYRETEALLEELKSFDLKQFSRSGRVTVTNSVEEKVTAFLAEQAERRKLIEGDCPQ